MARIDHNVSVAAGRDDRRDDQKGRSTPLDPSLAKHLGDRNVQRIVPSNMDMRIEYLPGHILGHHSLDVSCGARGRFAVSMDQHLNQADSEARARVDG